MTGIPSHLFPSAARHLPVWVSPGQNLRAILNRAMRHSVAVLGCEFAERRGTMAALAQTDLTDRDPGDEG